MSTDSLHFHPLQFLAENDGVVVGRIDIDSYAVLPPDGAELIRRLSEGMPVDVASAWYEETFGDAVDMEDFLLTLQELEFICEEQPPETTAEPVRWQRLGQALFSPPAWALYAGVVAAAVYVSASHPSLRPNRNRIFFSHYLLLIELVAAAGTVPLILVHELFHVLAGRRLGVRSRIRLGQRFYFLVFETVMDQLVLVPRRRRYLPMLAGMVADVLIVSLLVVVADLLPSPGPLRGVLLLLAFTTLIRFAMQFLLFLRTDLYYLLVNLSGCIDLDRTTRQMLANKWWTLVKRPSRLHPSAHWHPNDVRVASWYQSVFALGYVGAAALMIDVALPVGYRFVRIAVETVAHGRFASPLFWDACGLLALNVGEPLLAATVRRHRRHSA